MNKVMLMLALLLFSLNVKAQGGISESQLDSIKNVVKVLQSDLADCKAAIAKVTEQNLALKNALHLQPAIAESTTEQGLNFKLIGATGNSQKQEVTLDIEVLNTTRRDVKYQGSSFHIVDELGYVYDYVNEISSCIGNPNKSTYAIVYLVPDTPVNIKVVISVPHECQYIKAFVGNLYSGGTEYRFLNIPISWTR